MDLTGYQEGMITEWERTKPPRKRVTFSPHVPYTFSLSEDRDSLTPSRLIMRDIYFEPYVPTPLYPKFQLWYGVREVKDPIQDPLNEIIVGIGKRSGQVCFVTLIYRDGFIETKETVTLPSLTILSPSTETMDVEQEVPRQVPTDI